ncbi:MAG: helix-turn-helix domain-containing protein [Pseudonocardiaceae bacterium]
MDDRTAAEVIEGLRSLLEVIDTGRIEANVAQRAYLAGAVDMLVAVSERKAVGRPKALTPDQERQIRALHETGEGVPALVATFGVSRATVYRLLAEGTVLA